MGTDRRWRLGDELEDIPGQGVKTGVWIRTVDAGRRQEGWGCSREDWQAFQAGGWQDRQSTTSFVSATAPRGLSVPRGRRGSTFLTRVSGSCVASHRLVPRAGMESRRGVASFILCDNNTLQPAIFYG